VFHLPEMSRHYPAARFVMTHRDPVLAIPSACEVVLDARKMFLPGLRYDQALLGAEMLGHFSIGMEHAMEARRVLGEHRFLDVGQEEVELDPVGTAERIYAFAGLQLPGEVRDEMGRWAGANRRGSRGPHVYSAEEFGLTAEEIRDRFGDYRRRFAAHIGPATTAPT
jgi:hypothetical protein